MESRTWPRLYGEGSKGNTKEWQITAHQNDDGTCYTEAEFGGTGNTMQHTRKDIPVGKQGRTVWEQCQSEAQSDFDKKVKKGYRESVEALRGTMDVATMVEEGASAAKSATASGQPILPMLAHSFEKRGKDIKWPAFAQAKIDGHRAYGTEGKLLSRGGDPVPGLVNMPHIQAELNILAERLPGGTWYDGELYSTAMPFGRLSGCIRRASLKEAAVPLLPLLKYYIFDIFAPDRLDLTNQARVIELDRVMKSYPFQHIVPVPVNLVENEEQLMDFHDQAVQAGFEGIIIRNCGGHYKIGHRSADIQKFKRFKDEEFEIVGYKEGTGTDAGSVVWMCKAHNGDPFEVRPMGSIEYRRDLFNNGQQHVGKLLTVRYQNLSEYGIPRFPVGKDFRETGT